MASFTPTTSPTKPFTVAELDAIGLAGLGTAAALAAILLAVLTSIGRDNRFGFNLFDVLFLVSFVITSFNAASGVAVVVVNLPSSNNVEFYVGPLVVRCIAAVGILVHIQYYKFLEKHWQANNRLVKLVVVNMEALDLVYVMAPIMNGIFYVELVVNDFELYAVTLLYVMIWILRKIHVHQIYKDKADTDKGRPNIVYRSISQNALPLNAAVLFISAVPLSVYLALHSLLGWELEEKPQKPKPTPTVRDVEVKEANTKEKKDDMDIPTMSRLELFGYAVSLGIDIYLTVDLTGALRISAVSNDDNEIFINTISFCFSLILIGLDVATLKSYFGAEESLLTIEEEDGSLRKIYLIYAATARVESCLLLALTGVLAANVSQTGSDPLGLIFVIIDYVIINVRVWLRLTSIAQVKAFDIKTINRVENYFPLNLIPYGLISAADIFVGFWYIGDVLRGAFRVARYGENWPKGDLHRYLELLSTHGY